MRYLHVITAFRLGGAEEVSVNIAVGLAKRGHDIAVVSIERPEIEDRLGQNQKQRLEAAGIGYQELGGPNRLTNLFWASWRLLKLCNRWRPDLIHSHTDKPDFFTSLVSRFKPIPVVRTIHNSVLWQSHRLLGRLTESGLQNDLVVFLSKSTKKAYQDLRRRYRLPESRCQITIKNGVPIYHDSDHESRETLAQIYGADPKKMQFCFSARFTKQKGLDLLLDVLADLPKEQLARFQLHAFGYGHEHEHYLTFSGAHNLPVLYHPPTPEIGRLFGAFDAILMPSRFEGLALVALHGLAARVPVIAFAAPGLVEALPPDWPLLVAAEDTRAFGQKLIQFLDGQLDAQDLGNIGRQWVEESFTISQMVDQYDAAYKTYLDGELC